MTSRKDPRTAEACREAALRQFRAFLGFADHAPGEPGLRSIARHLRQAPSAEAVTLGTRMYHLIQANVLA